jgi:hypothetical protein
MLSVRRYRLAALAVACLWVFPAATGAVEPRLLPANTELVFSVNIKQVLGSELAKNQAQAIDQIKAALDNLPNSDEVTKYLKQMGFDPFTHLTSVTVALPANMDRRDVFVVIDGIFDARKFADTAKSAADNNPGVMKLSKFETTTYYDIQIPGDNIYVALLGGKSLVLTPQEDALKGAITRYAGTKIAADKVKDLLKITNDQQSLNFVITGQAMVKLAQQAPRGKGIPAGIGDALKDIVGLSGAVTLTKEINFQLGLGSKDAKTAQMMANQGQLVLAVAKIGIAGEAQNNPDLAPLVDILQTLQITSMGSNALLSGSVSQANLEKLIKILGEKLNK